MKSNYTINSESKRELERLLLANNQISFEYCVKRVLRGKLPRKDVAFWPNAQIVHAYSFDTSYHNAIKQIISLWERRRFVITEYDDVLMAYVLLEKTTLLNDEQKIKITDSIMTSLHPYMGRMIPYRRNNPNVFYADLLGMVPQFLVSFGIKKQDEATISWGVQQFVSFMESATDAETGLPYHAYNNAGNEKLGIIGWGRAMGWIMTGLAESIVSLDGKHPKEQELLLGYYEKYLEMAEKYQRKDGGISWQLQALDGPLDSSATAMILQSMCIMNASLGIDKKFNKIMQRMFLCLDKCYADGKVKNCSAECGGIGVYPQNYGSFAWSVAPYVICKALTSKKEIGDVER